jgi:release factor glutamine methyltransferase
MHATSTYTFPTLDHFHFSEFTSLYEPAEDTYLLCDSLSQDLVDETGSSFFPISLVVEIGSGSGVVSAHVLNLLSLHGNPRPLSLCIDISPIACNASLRTATANNRSRSNFPVDAICSDLLGSLLPRIQGNVDLLVFNPPYVPTPDDEVISQSKAHSLSQSLSSSILSNSAENKSSTNALDLESHFLTASWAGGERGRRVLDRALPQIAASLSRPNGRAYIVLVEENNPIQIEKEVSIKYGLKMTIIKRTKAKNENLLVVLLTFASH